MFLASSLCSTTGEYPNRVPISRSLCEKLGELVREQEHDKFTLISLSPPPPPAPPPPPLSTIQPLSNRLPPLSLSHSLYTLSHTDNSLFENPDIGERHEEFGLAPGQCVRLYSRSELGAHVDALVGEQGRTFAVDVRWFAFVSGK